MCVLSWAYMQRVVILDTSFGFCNRMLDFTRPSGAHFSQEGGKWLASAHIHFDWKIILARPTCVSIYEPYLLGK